MGTVVAQGETRATGDNDDDMAVDAVATLNGVGAAPAVLVSPTPRNLFELWQEYQVGIGGRKAARRLFTARERVGSSTSTSTTPTRDLADYFGFSAWWNDCRCSN